MTTATTRKIVLWCDRERRETDKARLFHTFPKSDPNSKEIWLPRSITHHVSRDPMRPTDTEQRCTLEIEEWFLDKNEL